VGGKREVGGWNSEVSLTPERDGGALVTVPYLSWARQREKMQNGTGAGRELPGPAPSYPPDG